MAASVKQLVNENSIDDFKKASEILLKFAGNILRNPNEQKYRKIRLANPLVESKLLPVSGAIECLFEMGFVEDGEHLSLPVTASLKNLREVEVQLIRERDVIQRTSAAPKTPAGPAQTTPAGPTPGAAAAPRVGPQVAMSLRQMQMSEGKFYQKLQSSMSHVLMYESASLQSQARLIIPVSQLEEEAKQQCQSVDQSDMKPGTSPLDVRDCLMMALMNWFKTSFFSWVDAPDCDFCGGKTTNQGHTEPTAEELKWGGGRVENYRCGSCQRYTRFPRYNHPGKLLETRRGRCGEWANCFTLCCRALQFEARYVLDWTDHVWTEVYSESQRRWLHLDPCENTCDKPLLYEVGWGKALSYVIAFGRDSVQDVSWRYSADHKSLLARRNECREQWLVRTVGKLQQKFLDSAPEARKKVLLDRTLVELVEFLTPKKADKENLSGRTSGSMAWRAARGETGQQAKTSFVFQLTEGEKQKKCLHLVYNCAADRYVRISDGGNHIAGYQSRIFSSENMFRKEEQDWKMAYLARTEGTDKAEIVWKFDFSDSGSKIDKIEIRVDCSTFESGKIDWLLCSDETCAMLKGGPSLETVTELEGQTGFTLTGSLRGGNGSVAWQHTQLFRQSTNDTNSRPLEIKVFLK